MQQLALFDLDNTLLPIDSDVSWAQFLVDRKVVNAQWYSQRNDHFYAQYCAGTLDIYEFLEFQLAPLAQHPRQQLLTWREDFMREVVQPAVREEAMSLVKRHQSKGALCAIVTATNSFITGPIARAFGVEHLIATEIEIAPDGNFTGRPSGLPSFREGKVTRVEQWLAMQGLGISDFADSWFYSDSMNDLPLLARVRHPVAVNPDQRLRAHAQGQGWEILDLFDRSNSTDD
ncbi:MAG: HAD family hydrolase [Burkholderiaceae bacterium]|jgi:HAD superfamily hydrolase (TIGR01490 family)|nr:HAD family hydrolase [Burkholderiaceae bacterium]